MEMRVTMYGVVNKSQQECNFRELGQAWRGATEWEVWSKPMTDQTGRKGKKIKRTISVV